ncbi:MAG: HIT family protein [Dehalococcoidia bacterium]
MSRYCVFCEIVERREPAIILHEDDDTLVFENVLGWTRVMLLAVSKLHRTQSELWSDLGQVGRVAVEMGKEHAPEGFRILSNFGPYGMQSQSHGHLHILSGTEIALERRHDPPRSIVDIVRAPEREMRRTDHAIFYDERAIVPEAPLTALVVPNDGESGQTEFWSDIREFGEEIVDVGWESSENGFRLLSNFPSEQSLPGGEKAHVHLLGGAFLGHYA